MTALREIGDVTMFLDVSRQFGAPARLIVAGAKLEVRPTDDERRFQEGKPKIVDGEAWFDAEAHEAREKAIVRNVLSGGPIGIVLLGGMHELADDVPEGVRIVRVERKAWRRAVEE